MSDQAVCVRVWDWSETSQTLLLLTRTLGLVRALAKGAKRANANFSGGLEPMTRGEIVVSTRNLEKAAPGLATLTAWDLVETFPQTRRDLDTFYTGLVMLDLVQHGLHDADPHPALHDALVHGLREACEPMRFRPALLRFTWTILRETGHAPELELDLATNTPLPSNASFAFLPRRGGFTRDDTGPLAAIESVVWRVRATTRDALRAAAGERPVPDDDACARAVKLLLMYFREVHQVDPKAVRTFLERA